MGFGFVVRDYNGFVILAGSKRCRARGSSTLVEALALRYCIQHAYDSGLTSFLSEMDPELLTLAIRGERARCLHYDTCRGYPFPPFPGSM
ncbi:hypothetical protein ACS0TY_029053 [Phlomoides rotata]